RTNEGRKLIGISDDLPPHLQDYLTKERRIDLGRARSFLRCVRYEVRGRTYEVIGFPNASGGYELRGAGLFKGTLAPKDITPIFPDGRQPVCLFEGFMDFLSFLSMKEKVGSHCLVMNSVANVGRCIRYLRERHITVLRAFLDNDDAGKRTLSAFIDAGFQVEDMSVHYRGCKDLNEFYVSRIYRLREQREQAQITTKPSHPIKLKRR
ncbi:toprim-like protein, partial [Tannerella sp. oral taxon BU063 isolate Cell 5]